MAEIVFEAEPGAEQGAPPMHVPRGALVLGGAMIGFTILLAASARLFGFGAFHDTLAREVTSRELQFVDMPSGGVRVLDAPGHAVVAELQPGTNGFLRGALRTLTHARRVNGIGAAPPFRLVRYTDGRLILIDPSTQQRVTITSFGPTQVEAFDRLLR